MPGGHDRHVVICFACPGDPRGFYSEALGEPWLGLWCLWGGRGTPAAQIEPFELPVRAGVHFVGVQGGMWARILCILWRPVAACGGLWQPAVAPIKNSCWLSSCIAALLPSCLPA